MKQLLLLAAIYSLIINQSNKNTEQRNRPGAHTAKKESSRYVFAASMEQPVSQGMSTVARAYRDEPLYARSQFIVAR